MEVPSDLVGADDDRDDALGEEAGARGVGHCTMNEWDKARAGWSAHFRSTPSGKVEEGQETITTTHMPINLDGLFTICRPLRALLSRRRRPWPTCRSRLQRQVLRWRRDRGCCPFPPRRCWRARPAACSPSLLVSAARARVSWTFYTKYAYMYTYTYTCICTVHAVREAVLG